MAHYIHPDLCIACGTCEPNCPVSVISQGDNPNSNGTNYFVIDADGCIDCGICPNVCPVDGCITDGH